MKIVRAEEPKGISYEDIKQGEVFTWGSGDVLYLKTDTGMVHLVCGYTEQPTIDLDDLRIINGSFVEE